MTKLLLEPAPATPGSRTLPAPATRTSQAAVVVNASKFSPEARAEFQATVDAAFLLHGWLAPLWLHTSARTRGADEARAARRAGVDLVLVAGGDGTIRTVAQELAGSGVPIALLPLGTGNLLAINLAVPRGDPKAAVAIACTGVDRSIDVGWLELELDLDRSGGGAAAERFAFLVMAGTGFDAAVMEGADATLKSRLGPGAYLLSGARAIRRRMTSTTVNVDGMPRHRSASRGVIVGNCGSITFGLPLMPDADPADGELDGVMLLPRSLRGWVSAACSLLLRGRGAHRLLPRMRGRLIEVRTDTPQPVEVDGDVVGRSRNVRFTVQPAGLRIRCR